MDHMTLLSPQQYHVIRTYFYFDRFKKINCFTLPDNFGLYAKRG